ncbi:hypothetical protein [Leifsonia poae]|uniref:hypothetical protein n=1 Tax=Leifsonia poae TaxID=110933 RepID=UPI001CBC1B17|nr:hypothetical protein [Leifsonia poae]
MLGEASGEAAENTATIDLSTFDKTLSLTDIATKIRVDDVFHFPWFLPIDTISPTHTVGKGRTNLTLIAPDILQTDTTGTPYASFTAHQTPPGGPGVSVHFEPGAYGITGIGNYVISFALAASGPVTLSVGAYAGSGTVTGAGVKTVTGTVTVSVVLQNVPPGQPTYASVQQTAGAGWSWYSTSIEHPPLIITTHPLPTA